jgi:uncharacterized protein YxjI
MPWPARWVVHMDHGLKMDVTGNIIDHEYTIVQGDREVAVVTKRRLDRRDRHRQHSGRHCLPIRLRPSPEFTPQQ